jgi:hypothetical protein
MPSFPGELTAIFVMATIANCDIDTIDASAALVSSNTYFKRFEVLMIIIPMVRYVFDGCQKH